MDFGTTKFNLTRKVLRKCYVVIGNVLGVIDFCALPNNDGTNVVQYLFVWRYMRVFTIYKYYTIIIVHGSASS